MITYPLNKIEYQATDAELFHCTRNSGIYSGEDFRPNVSGVDNIVNVSEGIGWIRNSRFSGKVVCEKTTTSVDLGLSDASLPRWDVVCLQFDKNKNATEIVVKNGTPASSPLLPEISQTETLYELYICKVYRKAGAVSVTAGDVTDLRLDPVYCGLMADSVTSVDTDAINEQAMALIETLQREISNASSGDKGINVYTASGTISNLTLNGVGANGKFKANVSGNASNITVNGAVYRVLAGGETEIELVANTWYFFILDNDDATINFKGGGGISNTALATTTADVADTLINKTFYSKDKVLKTGTMPDKSGTTQAATASLDATNSRLQMTVPAVGKYSTSSKLYTAYSTIRSLIGLTAAKIATGISILGITGTYKGVGNANADEVLAGRIFSTANVSGATGTMVNNASSTQAISATQGGNDVLVRIPTGAYINKTSAGYPEIKINNGTLASAIGLTPDKLLEGDTVLGVEGTVVSGIKLNITNRETLQTWTKTSVAHNLPAGDYKAYALMTMQTYPDDSNYLKCEVVADGSVVATITGLDVLHDPSSNYKLYYINKSADFTLSKTASVYLRITAYSKSTNFGTWHTSACSIFKN